MLNKYLKRMTTLSKFISIILLIIMIFIAKSTFFILSLTIISTIFLLELGDIEKNVKEYFNTLKKTSFILMFVVLAYIIIIGFNARILLLIYKMVICVLLIKCLLINSSFEKIDGAIYKLLSPLKKTGLNIDSLSYNLTLYIYFVKYIVDSGDKIKKARKLFGKKGIHIKELLIPRFLYSLEETNKLENNLKINFYTRRVEKINSNSIVILSIFIILFIISIFKEVYI